MEAVFGRAMALIARLWRAEGLLVDGRCCCEVSKSIGFLALSLSASKIVN